MTNMQAKGYWDSQFSMNVQHHVYQNQEISKDFLSNITQTFREYINNAGTIIEIGCGTGEMTAAIGIMFRKRVLGTDFSMGAISYAQKKNSNGYTEFRRFDPLNSTPKEGHYNLAICSNTLEHFQDPYILINKILEISDSLILLVPYDQPITDGFETDGGAGHVFQFTGESFNNYDVIDGFLFTTNGWQHSANGETPIQMAMLITKKKQSEENVLHDIQSI